MKGTSKFIMGATLAMVVSLAIVLGLILVLLAELYCSLLLRRRKTNSNTNTNTIPISTTQTTTTISSAPPSHTPPHSPPPPLANIYSQGVLQAPRTFLFPSKDEQSTTPRGIGLVTLSPSPLASFLARAPPQHTLQVSASEEHLVYISNPIYEEGKASEANTPFETPHTSPSRLERSGSSGDDDDHDAEAEALASLCGCAHHSPPKVILTPPLTPIKKLPAEASSVSLRDATSLSDSHSVNGPSSSSSDSPCTSPSW
ncbi:putative proline-rich receptor-like protein kinase PERK11 [Cajanus cajan]|uniref:Uncharacterized protein n=1 Tax=Cajanus cajan TaxID=3821 RepID=A0A151S3F2_CAJCA|nr:putative proline-rich receptor-like protein kinase PERK11 [Cajanus cajan]KYP49336.1 hypothetical protein KK1_028974 [Cajanus cajan]